MNNVISSDMLLSQLRQMAESAGVTIPSESVAGNGFTEVMQDAIRSVSDRQVEASELARQFEYGESDVSLAQVMIEMQKARVSFEALTQVRNKFITAYQEIMSMPL